MEENTPNPDEVIQQLKLQNFELAQRLQFWRLESNRLMNEKHVVMKENNDLAIENNSYREQLLKFRNMEHLIRQSLTRSLTDIVNGSEHIRKTLEVFSNQTAELRENSSSPKRSTSTSSVVTNNVNHVHPMIKGITIKKPVIRISRAIFEPEPIASSVSAETNGSTEESESISSREVSAPTQQVEMLDLCVSLCRVDSPDRRAVPRTPKQVFPSPSFQVPRIDIFNQPDAVQTNLTAETIREEIEQEGVEDQNVNEKFTDGDGSTVNFLPDGCFEYRSRLECLIEESDISSKLISSPKPNPFVALSRTLEDESSKSEQNSQSSAVDEDPLEGPSWRYDNVTTRRGMYVATRKKKKTSHSNTKNEESNTKTEYSNTKNEESNTKNEESNTKNEELQMPDSTTNNASSKDLPQEETSFFDKTYPAAPDYQSTPIGNPQNVNKKVEETPENDETVVPSPAIESSEEPQPKIRKKLLHAKVALDKMEIDSAKTSPRRKQPKAKKAAEKKTKSQSEPKVTTPKKTSEHSSPSTPSSRGSTLLLSSEENSTEQRAISRPRRGAPKDYKERNLHQKLRNENSKK